MAAYHALGARYHRLKRMAAILIKAPHVRMHPAEMERLAFYAAQCRILAVEIGTFEGGSACLISKALSGDARLVSIDPYIPDSMDPASSGSLWLARLSVLRHGNAMRTTLINGFSADVARGWDRPIDLLWIDGDHRYESVRQDFLAWSPFVCKGGHILFHDSNKRDVSSDAFYDDGWCGPTRLFREIRDGKYGAYEHVESCRSMNVLRKS